MAVPEGISVGSTPGVADFMGAPAPVDGWVEAVAPGLVGALALYCGDPVVAQDVAQEALVRLWLRWDRVANRRAWLYRTAFNLATSGFRRRRAERRALDRAATRDRSSPGSGAGRGDAAELGLDLRAGLARLPARQRQAILLRYLNDFTIEDVAEAMGCAPGTVKAHLARGLAGLRAQPGLAALVDGSDLHELGEGPGQPRRNDPPETSDAAAGPGRPVNDEED